jgi:hypothetical protein
MQIIGWQPDRKCKMRQKKVAIVYIKCKTVSASPLIHQECANKEKRETVSFWFAGIQLFVMQQKIQLSLILSDRRPIFC